MVVALWAEQSLPTPEVHSSNPIIGFDDAWELRVVDVTEFAEWSIPTPENPGSNPLTGNFYANKWFESKETRKTERPKLLTYYTNYLLT